MAKVSLPSLIGVIHLPALAGAPGAAGLHPAQALQRAGAWAVKEAKILTSAGFEGIILENFGDIPFYRDTVPAETVSSMAVIAAAVREATRLPLGINILRNDGRSALAVASVTGCDFIRVNVLAGVVATDQGLVDSCAAELMRARATCGAEIGVLGDAHVKHARTLSSDDIGLAVEETALRAMADGVIVTGDTTGRLIASDRLRRAAEVAKAHKIPLWIGSGSTPETLPEILPFVKGIIVGSALRQGGVAAMPLDLKRIRAYVKAYQAGIRKGIKKKPRKTNTRK